MFELERAVGWVAAGDAAARSNSTKPGDRIGKLQLDTLLLAGTLQMEMNKSHFVECVQAHTVSAVEAKVFEATHHSADETLCLTSR